MCIVIICCNIIAQEAFWRFSIDQAIKYDIPAKVHFIANTTGRNTMVYVGHSEGGGIGLAAFSNNIALAQHIGIVSHPR